MFIPFIIAGRKDFLHLAGERFILSDKERRRLKKHFVDSNKCFGDKLIQIDDETYYEAVSANVDGSRIRWVHKLVNLSGKSEVKSDIIYPEDAPVGKLIYINNIPGKLKSPKNRIYEFTYYKPLGSLSGAAVDNLIRYKVLNAAMECESIVFDTKDNRVATVFDNSGAFVNKGASLCKVTTPPHFAARAAVKNTGMGIPGFKVRRV